jgi:alpha-aminoadipate carrier protein LysW
MTNQVCQECAAELPVPSDVMPGEVIICPECGESWEVKKASPFEIVKAEAQGEDWGQ